MFLTRRALAYVRRSSSDPDFDPRRQLECIIIKAGNLGLRLDAKVDDVDYMQRTGLTHFRGLVLEDGISAE
jgi:hypothetical protein